MNIRPGTHDGGAGLPLLRHLGEVAGFIARRRRTLSSSNPSLPMAETGTNTGAGLNDVSGILGSGAAGDVVEADVFVFFEAFGASFASEA